jgi:tRNA acetyltransferase TAN1
MTFNFNLLVSTPRNFETDALAELDFLVHRIRPECQFNYGKTIVKGLIWGNVIREDPVEIVHDIRDMVLKEKFPLQFLLKFVPVQQVVITDLEEIEKYIIDNLDKIEENETFKIIVNKRRIHDERTEIIDRIAKNVQRKVNLDEPDKIIRLEMIGKYTGISILKEKDVFSAKRVVF